jgi:DNA-binding transcriptional ArsR family regulator
MTGSGTWLTGRVAKADPSHILNRMVQSPQLSRTFAALSDPTRRDMLKRIAEGPVSISDLARAYAISLPGVLKHVRVLEAASLVTTEKRGRTRECLLGPDGMEEATAWIDAYRTQWTRRLDGLEAYIAEKQRGVSSS